MFAYSTPLYKALTAGNSQLVDFDNDDVVATEPLDEDTFPAGIGTPTAGPQQLLILPYCEGPAGNVFYVRLYGWWPHGNLKDRNNLLWLRLLLVEFRVVSGSVTGLERRLIKASENFAESLEVTGGTVGRYGLVQNGGVAYAKVDLQGCQKYQFVCAKGADGTVLGSNALWAITSSW